MHIPRLLLLSLLIPACVAPVAAQALSDKMSDKLPVSSKPQLDGLVTPPGFRTHALPQSPNMRLRIRNIQPPFDSALAENDTACYSIRSYRVTRDDPGSDSTRLAGYSECQPAGRFQVKIAVDSREMVPR